MALVAALIGAPASAQTVGTEPAPAERIAVWDKAAKAVEDELAAGLARADAINLLRETMEAQRVEARALADEMRSELGPIEAQLETLGPAPESPLLEAEEVRTRRGKLAVRRAEIDGKLKAAELAATRAETLVGRLIERQRSILTDRLIGRGPSLFAVETWRRAFVAGSELALDASETAVEVSGRVRGSQYLAELSFGALAALAALAFGAGRMRRLADWLVATAGASAQPYVPMLCALALSLLRAVPPIAVGYAAAFALDAAAGLSGGARVFVWGAAHALAVVAAVNALSRVLFAPKLASQRILPMDDAAAINGVRRAVWVAATAVAARWAFDSADASGASVEFLAATTAIAAAIGGPAIFWLARSLTPQVASAPAAEATEDGESDEDFDLGGSLRAIARFAGVALAAAIPISAAFSFFALSQFLLERGALTIGVVALLGLGYVTVRRLFSAPTAENAAPGATAGLAVALAGLAAVVIAAPTLAYVWGASIDELRLVGRALIEGVKVGDVTFSFGAALQALAVLVVGLWLTRALQRVVRRNVLPNTKLERGAQTSISAALGYFGVLLTGFFAVTTIGLDLSNLAIVAGALSVGIGFGLQNVVNNFVSGLILLVERPVQVGDWVIVGGAEGYVRRISVRATEIERFDRASVIVPNSELISSQVTNWTHKNLTGRVICKVGVAYGSDVEKVNSILKAVASGHQMVLRYPAAFVLFRGFGESALQFELRAYIRDVNWVLWVESDMNFEILRRFREEGVEIAFPQRDVHLVGGSASFSGPPEAPSAAPSARPGAETGPASATDTDVVKGSVEGDGGADR